MLVKEMHIRFEEGVRKVNSQVYQNLQPEEIDFILTLAQNRIVKNRSKPQAEDNSQPFINQKVYDDLQNLIKDSSVLPTFVKTSSGGKGAYSYAFLPSDYMFLASDSCTIYQNCNLSQVAIQATTAYTEIVVAFNTPTATSGTTTIDKPFMIDNGTIPSSPNFYKNLNIAIDGVNLFTATDRLLGFGNIYTGYISQECNFYPVRYIMEYFNRKLPITLASGNILTGIYYERYNDYYSPYNFLFVFNKVVGSNPSIVMTYDNKSFSSSVIQTNNNFVSSISSGLTEVSSRMTKLSRITDVLRNNSFYGTEPESPISSIINDQIQVNFDNRFVVKQILIDYVRIPRQIDINLNQSCELKEELQYEVIDWAVEYTKMTINNPSWKDNVADNMLRSN